MSTFILLTTQRSGATFFLKSLSKHPQIECRHESVFTQDSKFKFLSWDRPSSYYYKYRSTSTRHQIGHWFRSKRVIFSCLDKYMNTFSNTPKAIGFKVSYNHIEKYPAIGEWIKEKKVRIIHLVRNNVFKTHLSQATAIKRGIAHSSVKVAPVKVRLNPRKLKRHLNRRLDLIEKYRHMFQDKTVLELSYENLVVNWDIEILKVLKFLDVSKFLFPEPDLVKLNPDTIDKIIENYDEVARALKGTPLEKYLTI